MTALTDNMGERPVDCSLVKCQHATTASTKGQNALKKNKGFMGQEVEGGCRPSCGSVFGFWFIQWGVNLAI
jgi:hypothetical protein